MSKKKKVIFFVNYYAGGAEKMTLNIASFLDDTTYEKIFYIVGKDLGLISKFIPKTSTIKFIKVKSYKDFLIFKIFKVIKNEKPDFVFSSLMPINWRVCMVGAFFYRVKIIIRINNYLYTQSLIQKIRLFLAYRFAKTIIVQTDEMNNEHITTLKLNKNKVVTLANPINKKAIDKKIAVSNCSPFPESTINYVFVGRIDPVKGIDVLLQSFSKILSTQLNAHLYILGDTEGIFEPYYLELLELAQRLKIQSKVFFMGFQDNPYKFMKYADCLVLPSKNEGLPNVILEALYLGTPVAATASIPVISRIINNGVEGFVVPVDDYDALADAMLSSVKLGRVVCEYTSATKQDFRNLF
ncbi:glycosyltransferase [Zunongwangia pacifica]|uniref:Glycosyltransferase n=1 Tax=Zunongwangia pacifica TaxID=2911062 RepID=A0A9X1ZSA6_9FLAO|nr:glycosyltransferase [Zunongwangia pacifica]MCL6216758.1 glycosyltransferase [Zunongwangia pacifica]